MTSRYLKTLYSLFQNCPRLGKRVRGAQRELLERKEAGTPERCLRDQKYCLHSFQGGWCEYFLFILSGVEPGFEFL